MTMNHQELVNDAVCQFSKATADGRQAFASEIVDLFKMDKGNTDAYRNDIKAINEQLQKVAESNPAVKSMLDHVVIVGADSAGHILTIGSDPNQIELRDTNKFSVEETKQIADPACKPVASDKSTEFSNEDDCAPPAADQTPPPAADQTPPAADQTPPPAADQTPPPAADQTPPPAEKPEAKKEEQDFDNYTVKKGDSLWKIAKRELAKRHPGEKITIKDILQEIDEIAKANGIDKEHGRDINKIREREPLKIPHAKK